MEELLIVARQAAWKERDPISRMMRKAASRKDFRARL
jgi:hypothetical protein